MKFKATYDGNHDTFRVEFLVVPVGGLSFLVNHDFSPLEVSLFIKHWLLKQCKENLGNCEIKQNTLFFMLHRKLDVSLKAAQFV